jgi:hypothetical protein
MDLYCQHKMDAFDKAKMDALGLLYTEAGAALADCQCFEYGIALLIFHFSRIGSRGLDPSRVVLILENKVKKTAGQLIAMLKKHCTVSPGIDVALEQGLEARNFLIHRSLLDNVERFTTAEGRLVVIQEIRKARRRVQKADKLLRPFITGFSEALDGVRHEEIEKEVRRLFLE